MTSLFDLAFDDDAIVREPAPGLVRCVRHADLSLSTEAADEVALVVNLSSRHRVEGRLDGRWSSDVPGVGTVTVMPPGCPSCFSISGVCRVLMIRVPLAKATELLGEASAHVSRTDVAPRVNADDPLLARLAFRVACSRGDDVEALAALVLNLAGSGHREPDRPDRRGGLAPARLRRVLERVEQDPGGLALNDLAREANMSRYHFARAFRRSTGTSPHAYVARRRVERALERLDDPGLSVGQVARAAGFSHASHLARVMRRTMGLTPRQFRASILP